MTINLSKKQSVPMLDTKKKGLAKILVGLGWDPMPGKGKADLDISAFMLSADNKLTSDSRVIFYNQLNSPDGSVCHSPDNLTGDGDGYDEWIEVDTHKVPEDVAQLLFVATIYESDSRGFRFGDVQNANAAVMNGESRAELCRYSLTREFDEADGVVLGRLYRDGEQWQFEAMGAAFPGGLQALAELYS